MASVRHDRLYYACDITQFWEPDMCFDVRCTMYYYAGRASDTPSSSPSSAMSLMSSCLVPAHRSCEMVTRVPPTCFTSFNSLTSFEHVQLVARWMHLIMTSVCACLQVYAHTTNILPRSGAPSISCTTARSHPDTLGLEA